MFDIGWSEMAIIMLLALIIIGPKDLPRVARTIGQWVRKGRAMAREFQTSLEDMARDTELDDVRKEIEKVGRTDFKKTVENTIDPKGDLAKAFDTSVGTDKDKPKPALTDQSDTDQSAEAGKKTPAAVSANGHVNGKAPPSAEIKSEPSTVAEPSIAKTPESKTKPAAKTTKTAATVKKPSAKTASKKPAAAKKPASTKSVSTKTVSTAKRSAKPASSASNPSKRGAAKAGAAKPGGAKRSADPSPADEGGGTDQAAVAAKPS